MDTPIIKLTQLSHCFGNTRSGIRDISLAIQPGEFILLAGRNGSGKTTLLRHLNGLLVPDNGRVEVNGKDIRDDLMRARLTVGMVFQDPDTQIVADTVYDETAFGLENLKTPPDIIASSVRRVLSLLGLYHLKNNNPATLSGGEKRKLAIAGVLVMKPRVIVFDEPFSNLDYPGTLSVLKTIVALNASGKTIIIASHDVAPVICEASRLLVMEDGELKHDCRPLEALNFLENNGIRPPGCVKFGEKPLSWLN